MTERAHPVLVAAANYRRQLLRNEDAAVRRMVAAYGTAYQRMGAQIQALQDSLDGQPMSIGDAAQLSRLRSLREQIQLEVGRFGGTADRELTSLARQSVVLGLNHSTGLVEATLTNPQARQAVMASFSSLTPAQIETMVGFLSPDSPLHTSLTGQLGPAVAAQVGDRLIDGIARGFNPRKTAAIVRRELGVGLAWAVNTTRTANLYAYREATRANYAANSRVVSGWTWYATLDGRVCGNCLSRHGSKHSNEETLNGHHQCRCAMLPRLAAMAASLGLDLPEIAPGEQWFAQQDEVMQQAILGPGMWAAWKDGAVAFDQFRGEYDHPVYGTMQRMPSMKDLGLERYYTGDKSGDLAIPPAPVLAATTGRRTTSTITDLLQPEPSAEKIVGYMQSTLNRVHKLPADIPPVPIRVGDIPQNPMAGGIYTTDWTHQNPKEIVLRERERMEFVGWHEMGHYLDHQHFLISSDFRYVRSSAEPAVSEKTRDQFWKVVKGTDSWMALDRRREELHKARPRDAAGVLLGWEVSPEEVALKYLTGEDETWARAYAQYISKKSGRLGGDVIVRMSDHWPDAEFKKIEKVMDKIFKEAGLALDESK